MKNLQPSDYKLNGIYRGVVEDNLDPEKAGRCKIRVFGIHTSNRIKSDTDGIPIEELPWSQPALSLFEGSVSGFGGWNVPLQGSHVFLFFENGNILQPRYFASAPGIPEEKPNESNGFSDPIGNYPVDTINAPHHPNGLKEPDFHKLARNENINSTIVESKRGSKNSGVNIAGGGSWDEPDPYYSAEYPQNKVYATHSGITIEIDDTDGEERIHVYHPSNSYIEINKNGDIIIKNAGQKFDISNGNKKNYVAGNEDNTVDGSKTDKIGTSETVDIGSSQDIKIGSNKTEEIGGVETKDISSNSEETVGGIKSITATSDITIISSTSITLQAPSVKVI